MTSALARLVSSRCIVTIIVISAVITLIIAVFNFHFYNLYKSRASSVNMLTTPTLPGAGPNVLYLYEKTGDRDFALKYGKTPRR
ncbi:MAG: hypothetical protein QXV48_02190 [Desulfurococcaceae archaeon]